jgi:hypothetical protein
VEGRLRRKIQLQGDLQHNGDKQIVLMLKAEIAPKVEVVKNPVEREHRVGNETMKIGWIKVVVEELKEERKM